MTKKHKEFKKIEKQMLIMKQFFSEYFRQTITKVGIDSNSDFTFLELKGLSAFTMDDCEYTMTELSKGVHLPLPNMTSIINRLSKKGMVKRRRPENDRRVIKVYLTDEGKKIRNKFMKKRVAEVENYLGKITAEDRKNLFNALKTAANIFHKIK